MIRPADLVGRKVRHLKYGDGVIERRSWTDTGAVHACDRHLYGDALVVCYHGGYEHFLQWHNGLFNEHHWKEIILLETK